MKVKLVKRWVYPEFPRQLEVSQGYIKQGRTLTIPVPYRNLPVEWRLFRGKLYLTNTVTNQRLTKPSFAQLNGQVLYSQSIKPYARAKIVRDLKAYFGEPDVKATRFPLYLRTIILCPRNDIHDLDNLRVIYEKVFIDNLKRLWVDRETNVTYNLPGRPILDDNVDWLSRLGQMWYKHNKSFLVFELYEQYSLNEDRLKILGEIEAMGFEV